MDATKRIIDPTTWSIKNIQPLNTNHQTRKTTTQNKLRQITPLLRHEAILKSKDKKEMRKENKSNRKTSYKKPKSK